MGEGWGANDSQVHAPFVLRTSKLTNFHLLELPVLLLVPCGECFKQCAVLPNTVPPLQLKSGPGRV